MPPTSVDLSSNSYRHSLPGVKCHPHGQPEELPGEEALEAQHEGGVPLQPALEDQAKQQLAGHARGLSWEQHPGDHLPEREQPPDHPGQPEGSCQHRG